MEFTGITSALGWIHKASFDPVNAESHDAIARWICWTLFGNKTSLYLQHIKVTENIITESISSYFHISDQTLTKLFNPTLPPQTAASSHIKQLTREVISWVSTLEASSIKPTESSNPLHPISLVTGKDSENLSHPQASQKNYWGNPTII